MNPKNKTFPFIQTRKNGSEYISKEYSKRLRPKRLTGFICFGENLPVRALKISIFNRILYYVMACDLLTTRKKVNWKNMQSLGFETLIHIKSRRNHGMYIEFSEAQEWFDNCPNKVLTSDTINAYREKTSKFNRDVFNGLKQHHPPGKNEIQEIPEDDQKESIIVNPPSNFESFEIHNSDSDNTTASSEEFSIQLPSNPNQNLESATDSIPHIEDLRLKCSDFSIDWMLNHPIKKRKMDLNIDPEEDPLKIKQLQILHPYPMKPSAFSVVYPTPHQPYQSHQSYQHHYEQEEVMKMEMDNFCRNCGRKKEIIDKFCGRCGNQL